MLKKLMWILPLALFMYGCSGDGEDSGEMVEQNAQPTTIVRGDVRGADNQMAYLMAFEGGEQVMVDSGMIMNGVFELETKTNQLREYILIIGESDMPVIFFSDESDTEITVSGDVPGIGENYSIEGSSYGQEVKDYLDFIKQFFDQEKLLYTQMQTTAPNDTVRIKEIMNQLDSISFIQRDYAIEKIEANPNSPTNWLLLRELFPASGLLAFDSTDLGYFEQVSNALKEKYPYSEYPGFIDKDIQNVQAQIVAMKNPPEPVTGGATPTIGEEAPEINLPDVNGNNIALSSLRGKTVLIDFWASWCAPCRKENPNVVNMYAKFKDKGFTVYSVSLDDNADHWKAAIDADNLTWPNHVSDLQGWNSAAGVAYGIRQIPTTLLIDENGIVIGTNLRGPQLEQKLQEVLG
ncbi:MAG: AhpC/TSA family protein [Crocinitomicaceae bacterium]|nr:AhpC/TSA family protein [Crocinitomicaceae bacterium]